MKKVLLSVFFAAVSLSDAKETQTIEDLSPHQRENIGFSIKEIPYQKSAQTINPGPTLAPEISEKQWRSLGEEKEAQEKRLKEEENKKENPPTKDEKNQEETESSKNQPIESKEDTKKQDKKDVLIVPTEVTDETNKTPKTTKPERKINKDPSAKDDNSLKESSANSKKITFSQEEFYSPKKNEISISKKSQKLFLQIHSEELQKFMEGVVYNTKQQVQTFALKDSYTQITNIDGKIQEYKYAQKSIDRYSAIAPHQKYPLKKVSKKQYQIIIKKIPPFFDIKGCKVVVKKELTGTLNQTKEIIINLDTKRELRNNPHFDLFLECPQ